jgi:carbon storage regulator
MLVLTRKVNERIRVGEDITITVVRLGPGSVRLGIDAPGHLSIVREELTQDGSSAALAGVDVEIEP